MLTARAALPKDMEAILSLADEDTRICTARRGNIRAVLTLTEKWDIEGRFSRVVLERNRSKRVRFFVSGVLAKTKELLNSNLAHCDSVLNGLTPVSYRGIEEGNARAELCLLVTTWLRSPLMTEEEREELIQKRLREFKDAIVGYNIQGVYFLASGTEQSGMAMGYGLAEVAALSDCKSCSLMGVTKTEAMQRGVGVCELFYYRRPSVRLTKSERQYAKYRVLEHMSNNAIATLTSVNEDAARKTWQRICEKLPISTSKTGTAAAELYEKYLRDNPSYLRPHE